MVLWPIRACVLFELFYTKLSLESKQCNMELQVVTVLVAMANENIFCSKHFGESCQLATTR